MFISKLWHKSNHPYPPSWWKLWFVARETVSRRASPSTVSRARHVGAARPLLVVRQPRRVEGSGASSQPAGNLEQLKWTLGVRESWIHGFNMFVQCTSYTWISFYEGGSDFFSPNRVINRSLTSMKKITGKHLMCLLLLVLPLSWAVDTKKRVRKTDNITGELRLHPRASYCHEKILAIS